MLLSDLICILFTYVYLWRVQAARRCRKLLLMKVMQTVLIDWKVHTYFKLHLSASRHWTFWGGCCCLSLSLDIFVFVASANQALQSRRQKIYYLFRFLVGNDNTFSAFVPKFIIFPIHFGDFWWGKFPMFLQPTWPLQCFSQRLTLLNFHIGMLMFRHQKGKYQVKATN